MCKLVLARTVASNKELTTAKPDAINIADLAIKTILIVLFMILMLSQHLDLAMGI